MMCRYFAEFITGPLGMDDTAFSIPDDKLYRFASCYVASPQVRRGEWWWWGRGGGGMHMNGTGTTITLQRQS